MADTKIIVSHNFRSLSTLLTGLGSKKELQQAVARSIKRTLPSAQRAAFSEIKTKKMLKLKASEMKIRARAYLGASGSMDVSEQYGKIWFIPKAESLGRFYARRIAAGRSKSEHLMSQNKQGGWQGVRLYSVRLNQYGQPYLKDPQRSFLVNRGGGGIIFARVAGSKRLPIEKQFGPGFAELVQATGIHHKVASVASMRYEKEFQQNARFYADKALARARAQK